jgi:eukaryotic-like serine/threonine-protein kinase
MPSDKEQPRALPAPPRPAARATGPVPPPSPVAAPNSPPISISEKVPPSDPAVAEAAAEIARVIGNGYRDPEASLDIPPPAEVEREKLPAGAKDPYIGTTFDHRYKIEQLLGEGGMGFVYLARHKVIDKKVAIKVLRADMAKDREILDRFLQEAKSASSIGNPHIVDISDFGDLPDGSTYFVMEYLEGQSLTQVMEAGARSSLERICHIGIQIADGLAAAHQRGIVHRDLKPDNIFVVHRGSDHDFVKIVDFGIAKVAGSSNTKLTKAGQVFGTPHYMSPEQAAGAPVDHRADIYALGVILYEVMAGQLPFNADNFMGILTQHMYKAPVPIRALVPAPECPPSLEAVILKCLSKKPEGRYQSMEDLGADIERVKNGGVPHAVGEMMARSGGFNVPHDYFKQPGAMVPATPPTQRKSWPTIVWIAGAVAAVGLVAVIFMVGGMGAAKDKPRTSEPAPPPAAAATATPSAAASAAAVAAPAPKRTAVAVAATPKTAQAFRDGKQISLPASLDVEDDKPIAIEIRAPGYETVKLEIDGTMPSKMVELKPLRGAATSKPGAKPTKGGSGDVVDPWAR